MRNRLCLVLIFLCLSVGCHADKATADRKEFGRDGVIKLAANFDKTNVSIEIVSSKDYIEKPRDGILSGCTDFQNPCRRINYVNIFVNNNKLIVAKSVYADLSDMRIASLRQENGCFVLELKGGDAALSYSVAVIFDDTLVRKRVLFTEGGDVILQETIYYSYRLD